MELVTGDSAPTLEHDEATRLLLEMAAVVRTIFGVDQRSAPAAEPVRAVEAATAAVPGVAVPAAAPSLPVPGLAVPGIPVPAPAPLAMPDRGDPEERHSLALLQEIAFLDE